MGEGELRKEKKVCCYAINQKITNKIYVEKKIKSGRCPRIIPRGLPIPKSSFIAKKDTGNKGVNKQKTRRSPRARRAAGIRTEKRKIKKWEKNERSFYQRKTNLTWKIEWEEKNDIKKKKKFQT